MICVYLCVCARELNVFIPVIYIPLHIYHVISTLFMTIELLIFRNLNENIHKNLHLIWFLWA